MDALKETFEYAKTQKSSAFLILIDGKIVVEEYWDAAATGNRLSNARYLRMKTGQTEDGKPIEDVASVQKSVVAVLLGIAIQKGKLKIDEPVTKYLGKGWSKATPAQESKITIRHLITMTSGLTNLLKFSKPAGTTWKYNTNAYSQTVKVIEKATQMSRQKLTKEWLTEPLGMSDSKWTQRGGIVTANKFGFSSTARDLAKFGWLVANQGNWNGKSIYKQDPYFKAMLLPSQDLNKSYGYLWWLNRGKRSNKAAPSDLVSGLGALGRKLYVSSKQELVIIRLGNQPELAFDKKIWQALQKIIKPKK